MLYEVITSSKNVVAGLSISAPIERRKEEWVKLVKKEFPDMHLCLSTNGLLLTEHLDRLVNLGVHSVTRITSYNVCYTKLLRAVKFVTETPAEEIARVKEWINTEEYKEKNFVV